MPTDWLSTFLPIINAAGIPILTIGIIMLLRAYQKATDTYRDVSDHLRSENERLSNRLVKAETDYFSNYEKMNVTLSNSMDAIQELQARKIALLSQTENDTSQKILTEVERINDIIDLLQKIQSGVSHVSFQQDAQLLSVNRDIQEITIAVGKLAEQIGDTRSRVAILGVITSTESLDRIKSEINVEKRGIVVQPLPEPRLQAANSIEDKLLDGGDEKD